MKNLKSLSIILLFLIGSSCGSLNSINPLSLLTGNSWILSSVSGEGLDLNQFAGGIPSLDFLEGGKLAGFSGCNNFSGNFSLEGTRLQLDPGAITKKSCSGTGEQEFLSAIERASQVNVDKNKLTLLDGSAELLSFVPRKD